MACLLPAYNIPAFTGRRPGTTMPAHGCMNGHHCFTQIKSVCLGGLVDNQWYRLQLRTIINNGYGIKSLGQFRQLYSSAYAAGGTIVEGR